MEVSGQIHILAALSPGKGRQSGRGDEERKFRPLPRISRFGQLHKYVKDEEAKSGKT